MTGLLVGLACFGLHMALTLVWLRLPGRLSPVSRHAISALATHVLGIVAAVSFAIPFAYWPAAAVGGFGAVCWLFAFSAVYKSVSLRILTELDRAAGGLLPFERITAEYVRPEFENRVEVLARMGCVESTEDGHVVTEKGIAVARRVAAVQRLFGILESGLYGSANPAKREHRRPEPAARAPGLSQPSP